MAQLEVVVVGGGVTGLTTALQLIRDARMECKVLVLAKSFDFTCSHAAGAWWIPDPMAPRSHFREGTSYVRWAQETWKEMTDMPGCQLVEGVRLYAPQALGAQGLEVLDSQLGSLASLVPKFQKLELEARPVWPGAPVATPEHFRVKAAGGASFETLFTCMETYLAYLRRQLNASGRCVLLEREVTSLEEVLASYPGCTVVNCAGLGAGPLAGDETTFGVRGQTVLVKAPEQRSFFSLQTGDERPVYVLPQGDGTVVVGGCTIRETPSTAASLRVPGEGGWQSPELDEELAKDLLHDAQQWCPALKDAPVLRKSVGWRPFRNQGARVERDAKNSKVIHNYGHGDVGVILSWGCAKDVADILMQPQSKL